MADYRAKNRNSKIVDARIRLAAKFSSPAPKPEPYRGGHTGANFYKKPAPYKGGHTGPNFLKQVATATPLTPNQKGRFYEATGIENGDNPLEIIKGEVLNTGMSFVQVLNSLVNEGVPEGGDQFGINGETGRNILGSVIGGPVGSVFGKDAVARGAGNILGRMLPYGVNTTDTDKAVDTYTKYGTGGVTKQDIANLLLTGTGIKAGIGGVKALKAAPPVAKFAAATIGAAGGLGLVNSDDAQAGVPGAGAVGVGAGARALQGVVKGGGFLERFAKEFVSSQYAQNVLESGRNINVGGLIPKDILEQGFGTAAAKSVEGLDAFKNLGSKLENKILIEGVIPQANETKASVNATIASGRSRFTDSAGPEVMKAFGINTGRFTKFDYGKPLDALHNLWQKDFPDATSGARVLGTKAAERLAGSEGLFGPIVEDTIPNSLNWKNIGRQFDHFKSPTDAGLYLKAIFESQGGKISDVDKRMAQTLWDAVHHPNNISGVPQEINLGMGGIPKQLLSSTKEVTSRLGKDVGGLMADSSAYVQNRIPLHETHWAEPALRGFNEWHSSAEAGVQQLDRLSKKLRGLF